MLLNRSSLILWIFVVSDRTDTCFAAEPRPEDVSKIMLIRSFLRIENGTRWPIQIRLVSAHADN